MTHAAGDRSTTDDSTATEFSTGTTVLALSGAEGVVLGADARVSLGGRFVTNQSTRKVEPIGDRAAVAFSGGVSDAQSLVEQLRAERRLYELDHDRPMATRTLATRAAGLIRSGQFRSLGLLLAGATDEPAVYEIDGAGGVLRTEFAASGSGMQLAYGALEDGYDADRSVAELRPLAASALEAAAERDVASGDGMTITAITADGLDEIRTDGLGVSALEEAIAAPADSDADAEEVA